MADNKVTIEIAVEGNAQVQFKKLSDSAAQFATETKKSFGDAGRIFDNFVANLASNAVTGALNGLKAGFAAFNDILVDSIKAASEQEDAINRLNSALKNSGNFSQATSQELQNFASQLQATTKYADEAILSATGLIASLGQLDKDGLKNATKAALDLSAALGIDLNSAANLVGKAADGNVSVLSRYGITVKETGDKAADFARALDSINQKFGGSAAAQVNTFSGAVELLKNQYGETQEAIGETIIKSPAVIEALKGISDLVVQFTSYISSNKTEVQAFIKDGILFMVDAFKAAVLAIQVLVGAFNVVEGAIQIIIHNIVKLANAIGAFGAFGDTFKQFGKILEEDTAGGVEKVVNAFSGFEEINGILDGFKSRIEATTAATQEAGVVAQEQAMNRKAISEEEALMAEVEIQNKAIQQEQAQANALLSLQNYLTIRNAELKKKDDELAKAEIAKNNERLNQLKVAIESNQTARLKSAEQLAEGQKKIDDARAMEQMNTLQRVATLQNAKTKELAAVGKAAAIALATIDTYKGANSALGSVPFPFNFVAAAAVIAAGLVNVSNIIGTPLATGITEVPAGFQGDTFPARLSSGERVVSAPQNRDLTEFISGSTGLTAKLDQLISVISLNQGRMSVSIDGRELVTALQNQLDSGRALDV